MTSNLDPEKSAKLADQQKIRSLISINNEHVDS